MKNEDTLYWLWLSQKCGVASKYFNLLMEKYQNPFDIYLLEEYEIAQFKLLPEALRDKLCEKDLEGCYEIMKFCKQERIDIITYGDNRYPVRLKDLRDPPILLYCRGHFPDFNSRLCIGIVGTRKMSEYGKQSAYKMAYEIGGAGILTVSGMALGIDGVSACGALEAGGSTVAVLGCGVDVVYPKAHRELMDSIIRHGAVISEYPPKEAPHGYNFPKRNRIISGLCQGVLVVEASVGSGALITAKDAIAQGREVFAIPGKISDPGAEGPNELIKSGAFPVLGASDILKHYEFIWGEDYDLKKLERVKKRMPAANKSLERYGMLYATETAEEAEPIFELKSRKKKTEAGISAAAAAQERVESCAEPAAEKTEAASESISPIVEGLDTLTRSIYESIPIDRAISPDALIREGLSTSDIITALTLMEIYGLISSLPGGLYIRK